MLEQIASLVKQFGQNTVVENPEVPNTENEAVMAEATNTIGGGFQNLMAGGGMDSILSLFSNNNNNGQQQNLGIGGLLKNPIVSMMVGHLTNKLMSKFKLNSSSANNIAGSLVPNVISSLVSRTQSTADADSGFNLNNLVKTFTGGGNSGGGGFDFQGLLSQFTGGGNSGGGGLDLSNIISQVTKGAVQNQEQQTQSGGLQNLIKGFFR